MRVITAYSLGNRGASLSKDARLLNGYAEGNEDSVVRSYKRPGLTSSFSVSTGTGATSTAAGINVNDIAVRGDILNRGI